MGLERTEEAPVRWGADGDPKGNPPRGATPVWTPTKAGPFSSLDTRSSVAFNHDWLVDPRGDPVGQLDATQRGGAIAAHEQPEVAVCGDTGEDGG